MLRNRVWTLGMLIVAGIALVAAGCGGGGDETAATTTNGETKEFTVVGTDFAFEPASLEVNRGDTVRITLKNEGSLPHDLVINDLDVKTARISAGDEETVEFTASRTGSFKIVCTEPGHEGFGMTGTLEVK